MDLNKSQWSVELQEDLKGDIEKQVNNVKKEVLFKHLSVLNKVCIFSIKYHLTKTDKYSVLSDAIQQIDDELDIPSLHTLLDKVTQDNIDDVLRAISVLIHSGADVDEHRNDMCVLQRLLELKNIVNSSDLETVIEMVFNNSEINYKLYKEGSLLTVLKQFSPLMYIKFRLLTDTEDVFLDLIDDPEYCLTIQTNLFGVTSRAVAQDGLEIVKRLFEVHTKNMFNVFEISDLLKKAVATGNLNIFLFLWEKVETARYVLSTSLLILTVQEVVNVKCDDKFKFYECFDYVLRMRRTDVNQRDNVGNVALYYACKYDDKYMVKELLKAKTWIGNKNERGELAISRIDAKDLEEYLDSCIKTRVFSAQFHQTIEKDNLVFFDYSGFMPPDIGNKLKTSEGNQPNTITEMDTINFIAENSNLNPLISHPLLRAFIQLKWRRFWPYVFINQQCSLFFLIITCLIMVNNYNSNHIQIEDLQLPVVVFGSFTIVLEMCRFALLRLRYFKQPINLLYIISIIFVFCYVALCRCVNLEIELGEPDNCQIHRRCYQISGFLALIWSIKFTILLYTFVSHTIGIYTVMLYKVAYNSLICILSNLMLFVGFSFAFFAIFNNLGVGDITDATAENNSTEKTGGTDEDNGINSFSTIGKAFYKVYVMFTGEMDAADLNYMDTFSYLLLASFVFIGPVVALNLLNGLAVDDVQVCRTFILTLFFKLQNYNIYYYIIANQKRG